MPRWYHLVLQICCPLQDFKEPDFIMQNSNKINGLKGSQGFTNLPDYSMEYLPYYKEEVFFKRYHKKLADDKAAVDATMVCS
jgi:hypothetical protein